MDIFAKCYEETIADKVRALDLYPYFKALESRQDKEVLMEGKRRIMLGSNNYLGLTTDPKIIATGVEALEHFGTGCSGSRFLNGTLTMHLELERELAAFLHKDEVVTFSTGYQSNLGIISAIVGRNDYVICDRENHASIYDGCKLSYGKMLRYRHSDMASLERCLKEVPEKSGALIVTDGIFSMGGDLAKLPDICELAQRYGARVMVDDAHGLGVIGEGGRGTASHFGLEDQVDIYMGTFSKSLASLGGYMAGDARICDFVRHASRAHIFSASIPPANCAVALASLRHLEAHPELVTHLAELAAYGRERYQELGIPIMLSQTPIIPIYTYDPVRTLQIQNEIYEAGVYVNAVLPPACAPGECLLRTSFMATLTRELINEAAEIMAEVIHRHE